MKKFYVYLASLTIVASAILLFNFMGGTSEAALPRDCNNNSIINCGAISAGELNQRYQENKTGDLPAIYNHYGISAQMIANAGSVAKMGEVHKDGRVTVNGEVVATNATSIGRQNIFSGSTQLNIGGKTFYDTPPSRSFNSNSIAAFVFFDEDGRFKAFILTSCSNPGTATPPEKPKPEYKCDGLAKNKISRTEYEFTATASASNATIIGYTFDFGDGKKQNASSNKVKHVYEKAGKYVIKVSVSVKVGNETKVVTGPACEVEITVEEEPATPLYRCDSLSIRTIKLEDRRYAFDLAYTAEGGAVLESVDHDFGDGKSQKGIAPAAAKTVEHTYEKAGDYKIVATLHFRVPGKETLQDKKCEVQLTAKPTEEKCPQNPQYPKNDPRCAPPQELPQTGPMDMIGGGLGLSAMIAAGYYWHASRRGLLSAFMQR